MAASDSLLSAGAQNPPDSRAFVRIYANSQAEELGLSLEEFSNVLRDIASRYLPPDASEAERLHFLGGLQLKELALARACAKGSEVAWDRFVACFRPKLRHAARAITRDEAAGAELADSLYADLFGTRQTVDGPRVSKLCSYMGRGSLEGWLKTVLAQEYINRIRRERRLVSFDDHIGEKGIAPEPEPSCDMRIECAIEGALAQLTAEERIVLAFYYLDGRTLSEIARMLGVHESTVSRRLDKTTIGLRKKMLHRLRELGMSAREAEQTMAGGARGLDINLRSHLLHSSNHARSGDANRSTREVS